MFTIVNLDFNNGDISPQENIWTLLVKNTPCSITVWYLEPLLHTPTCIVGFGYS